MHFTPSVYRLCNIHDLSISILPVSHYKNRIQCKLIRKSKSPYHTLYFITLCKQFLNHHSNFNTFNICRLSHQMQRIHIKFIFYFIFSIKYTILKFIYKINQSYTFTKLFKYRISLIIITFICKCDNLIYLFYIFLCDLCRPHMICTYTILCTVDISKTFFITW